MAEIGNDCERVLFTGRVQGVWFRVQCRDKADELGLSGWVANLPDGRVEAHLEGPTEARQALIDWCSTEMASARVAGVERTAAAPEGHSGFAIRRLPAT